MASLRFDGSNALRYSLLAALGLLGAACGGVSTGSGEPDPDPNTMGMPKPMPNKPDKLGQCEIDPRTQLPVCASGLSHRPAPVRCQPIASDAEAPDPGGVGPEYCAGDDCSRLAYGYCSRVAGGFGTMDQCKSGCFEDADCPSGSLCACGSSESPTGGECTPSNCRTDSDCGDGLCASTSAVCGDPRFACQTSADQCQTTADCGGRGSCTLGASGSRECFGGVCGRPFLVLSEPRLPPVTPRGDWLERSAPRVDHLTSAERAALAQHWTRLGQMEHASIAAFARFQLQLLALGASPDLVEQCTQALADETAHTKLCFGIASAYAGRAIGPGPLDVSNSLELSALADIVDLVLAEGCFGETSAALEALEAAHTATDPVIRAAYERIAADEQRHAELAFRFVRWALERGGSEVAGRIREALASDFAGQHPARAVAEPCLAALVARSAAA